MPKRANKRGDYHYHIYVSKEELRKIKMTRSDLEAWFYEKLYDQIKLQEEIIRNSREKRPYLQGGLVSPSPVTNSP